MGKLKSKRTRNRNRSKNKLYGGRSRKRRINKQFSKCVKKNYLSKKHRKSRKMHGGFFWWFRRRTPQLQKFSRSEWEREHGPINQDEPSQEPPSGQGMGSV